MTIPDKIRTLGDYDKFINMMIVGDAGFGKTVFAGTADNALFLTTDPEGTISALVFGSTAKEWKIETWSELNEAYRYLRDGGIKEIGLKWVIIDNISEAQNLGMKETMELARSNNSKLDEFISSQQDYLRSQNMLRQMVKMFNDLNVNILWTAWQTRLEDENGDAYYAPGIHGQQGMLGQTIAGYMNMVGYGEVVHDSKGDDVRRIWFSTSGRFRGKDRFNALIPFRDRLTIPKMERLVDAVKKSVEITPSKIPASRAKTSAPKRRATTPRKKS